MDKLKEMLSSKSLTAIFSDPKFLATSAGIVLATYYYLKQNRELEAFEERFNCQSLELPGPELIRINAETPSHLTIDECECKTIHEFFLKGVSLSGDQPFLGTRADGNSPYSWITYNEVYKKACYLGSALYEIGLRKGSFIGISAQNKPEWVIVDQGAMMFSMVMVPLYDTLGQEGMQHILLQTELSILFCDSGKLDNILNNAKKTKFLKTIVTFDNVNDLKQIERCKSDGIHLIGMQDLLDLGKQNQHEHMLPSPEDLALICYTSGTTGNPKGVMLSHENLAVNVTSFINLFDEYYQISASDSYISYLPLSHMYERCGQYIIMVGGGKIGFFRGNVKELVQDIQTLRPTIFPAVPRILNVLYSKVMNEVAKSWVKSLLMNVALSAKNREVSRGVIRKNSFWDKLVFNKIQGILGGRVKAITSGAAPLSISVKQFLKCAFGCLVCEGYGQTELTAMATMSSPFDSTLGHVGPPISSCRIKLVDVPSMDYFAKDSKGEVCVQGPSIFLGYFKDPEKTRDALDEEGWLHTGDIGKWLPNGTLCIIDRKKHIFKLAQGEYIAPEKIEIVYLRSSFVSQVFVTGDSLKTCTVAIVCPDKETIETWAQRHQMSVDFDDLCKNETAKEAVLASMREIGSAGGLNSLEQVKAVYLLAEPFSIENDLLTPTMKVKRKKVEERYAEEIKGLYAELDGKNK
ncbi:long-chain-fatty-acid--CoA ligase 5-like [Rhopilema esculentum]|uniref:long-chain-fatty-acid--CoA ligase 5-like n=1 Tax=Rhopilema esculentum TaxID=499914 RepID=UPI0031D9979F